jgi:hypothetical protein
MIMKKFLLLAGFIFTGILVHSQNQDVIKTKALSFGPSVGMAHAYMYPYITRGANFQGSLGVISIFAPWEHWGFGLDVRYSREGSKTRSVEGARETDLDYVRVPVKAIYFFNKVGDRLRPKITLGPSVGFLVKQYDTFDFKANDVDLGLNASAGFNYRLANAVWLNVDVNYYNGLTDVMLHTGVHEMNANIGLNVGVAFGIY